MLILLYTLIVSVIIVWFAGLIYANDFGVKGIKSLNKFSKVLIIFPHADDELRTCSGLITRLIESGAIVDWVVLTKGERGTPNARLDKGLAKIRTREALSAARLYGLESVIQHDFPDGGLDIMAEEVKSYLHNLIEKKDPDLIITYDRSGLYGHPDHMVVSDCVTNIVNKRKNTSLWYTSFSKRVMNSISLPEHMAKNRKFLSLRDYPNIRVFIGIRGMLNKIKGGYIYKSQNMASAKSMPIKWVPLWFYLSFMPYEYFFEVK